MSPSFQDIPRCLVNSSVAGTISSFQTASPTGCWIFDFTAKKLKAEQRSENRSFTSEKKQRKCQAKIWNSRRNSISECRDAFWAETEKKIAKVQEKKIWVNKCGNILKCCCFSLLFFIPCSQKEGAPLLSNLFLYQSPMFHEDLMSETCTSCSCSVSKWKTE